MAPRAGLLDVALQREGGLEQGASDVLAVIGREQGRPGVLHRLQTGLQAPGLGQQGARAAEGVPQRAVTAKARRGQAGGGQEQERSQAPPGAGPGPEPGSPPLP